MSLVIHLLVCSPSPLTKKNQGTLDQMPYKSVSRNRPGVGALCRWHGRKKRLPRVAWRLYPGKPIRAMTNRSESRPTLLQTKGGPVMITDTIYPRRTASAWQLLCYHRFWDGQTGRVMAPQEDTADPCGSPHCWNFDHFLVLVGFKRFTLLQAKLGINILYREEWPACAWRDEQFLYKHKTVWQMVDRTEGKPSCDMYLTSLYITTTDKLKRIQKPNVHF